MLINLMLANIGLPMVAVYLPFAWFALVPIIFIEAGYGARRYHLSFRRVLTADGKFNQPFLFFDNWFEAPLLAQDR
jgi:hypothetical protein